MTDSPANKVPTPSVSVVIMARDEAINIVDCLKSVEFADERIVVDTGSNDQTRELAQQQGATVVEMAWEGFGPTKAKALELATSEWVISLDADERITPALANEILKQIQNTNADGYEIPRRSFLLGHEMRYSGWGQDWVLRLIKRGSFRVTGDSVHERILVDGAVRRLHHPLDHHTNPTFASYLAKIDLYSTLAAEKIAADPNRTVGPLVGIGHALTAFGKKYFLQQGFRDGVYGTILAVSTAYEKFLRYTKAGLIRKGLDSRIVNARLNVVETDTQD